MTTIKDLVADARRMTYGSMTEQINLIDGTLAPGATTIPLQLDISGITPGMVLSSGLNVWYVTGSSPGDKQVFVVPGYDNSPQEAAADGDIVIVKPKVTDWYLFNVINDEITRLSSPTNVGHRCQSHLPDLRGASRSTQHDQSGACPLPLAWYTGCVERSSHFVVPLDCVRVG